MLGNFGSLNSTRTSLAFAASSLLPLSDLTSSWPLYGKVGSFLGMFEQKQLSYSGRTRWQPHVGMTATLKSLRESWPCSLITVLPPKLSAGHDIQWLLIADGAFRRFPFSELHETGKVLESEGMNCWIGWEKMTETYSWTIGFAHIFLMLQVGCHEVPILPATKQVPKKRASG